MYYALRHKKENRLMGFYTSSNSDGDFCTDVEFCLCFGENVWVTTDKIQAEYVANTNTKWYNAGFDSPGNEYVGELEVVELKIV